MLSLIRLLFKSAAKEKPTTVTVEVTSITNCRWLNVYKSGVYDSLWSKVFPTKEAAELDASFIPEGSCCAIAVPVFDWRGQ